MTVHVTYLQARFIHVVCLDRWRAASRGRSSSFRCDQCQYNYQMRRTMISGLASNKLALTTLTIISLLCTLYLAGFAASAVLDVVEYSPARHSSSYSGYGAGGGSILDEFFISDSAIIREAIKSSWSFFENALGGSTDPTERWDGQDEPDIQKDPTAWDIWNERTSPRKSSKAGVRGGVEHMLKGASLLGYPFLPPINHKVADTDVCI